MNEEYDVFIAGGGPVGAALALALRGTALRVGRVDAGETAGDRPIALSQGSRLILERFGDFNSLPCTPILNIHVSQQSAFGRTQMRAEEFKLPALGYVVAYEKLRGTLETWLAAAGAPGQVTGWQLERDGVEVTVESTEASRRIRTQLLVLADGGINQSISTATTSPTRLRDYAQDALVCQISVDPSSADAAARYTAYERFTPGGPLALLPYEEGYALVWCAASKTTQSLESLDTGAFLAALQSTFGHRAGTFARCGPRRRFPLSLRIQSATRQAGLVAIGNAAQTLHPVAGQGLNLGLRDAWELAAAIIQSPSAIGSADFARRFERQRSGDRSAVSGFTDALVRGYSNTRPLLAAARGAALFALDLLPPARRILAQAMMYGIRSLPAPPRNM